MSRAGFAPRANASALRSIVEGAESEMPAPEQVEEPTARRALEVGAADDRAEHEADAVAERVIARIGGAGPHAHGPGCGHGDAVRRAPAPAAGATIGAAGGALDESSSREIESAQGGGSALDAGVRREMEAGFGRSLGDVRIHTDSRADRLSGQMSARAFTTGRDIFFAQGQYDPASAAGKHTLAHELAHTVQDGGSARRKLRGTAEALESQGGGSTTGKLRKAFGAKTNWDKIVAGVRAYEADESKLLAGGKNPDPIALMKAKPGMLKILNKTLGFVKEWRKANDHDGQEGVVEKARAQKKKAENWDAPVEEDPRTKSTRRQAVAMLEPRVGNEVTLLNSKDADAWMKSLGLSTGQVKGQGRTDKGQVNEVKELHYQGENGEFSGYFKEDQGWAKSPTDGENKVGIRQNDPNYGARAVALYRLDQLFDANVTARAEFAVHSGPDGKSKLGTVLQTATGVSGGEAQWRRSGDSKQDGGLSLDDPVLQRGLNKLQLLDAISGQLDRHAGNYKIQDDGEGNVTGITGIDLDMAFGSKMNTTSTMTDAFNYKGIPDFIDKTMGEKILAVKASDLRDALTGLLSKVEIESTVSRFLEVQQAVKIAQRSGRLREQWDEKTAKGGLSWQDGAKGEFDAKKTYHQVLKNNWRWAQEKGFGAKMGEHLRHALRRHPKWQEMPTQVEDAFITAGNFTDSSVFTAKWYYSSPLVTLASQIILEADLPNSMAEEIAEDIVNAVLDRVDPNKLAVQVQEGTVDSSRLKSEMASAVQAATPALMQKYKS